MDDSCLEYDCPHCEYDNDYTEGYYYIKNNQRVSCSYYNEESNEICSAPPSGFTAYPIYTNEHEDGQWVVMGGLSWDETHCCENCGKEYTYQNSNY